MYIKTIFLFIEEFQTLSGNEYKVRVRGFRKNIAQTSKFEYKSYRMVPHSGTGVRINIENFSGTTSVISVKDGRKEGFGIDASSPDIPCNGQRQQKSL